VVRGDEARFSLPLADDVHTLTLDTSVMETGAYTLTMLGADGGPVATNQLWVRSPGAESELRAGKRTYDIGEPVQVTWADAPGNKWDWVGVYRRDADPNTAWYKNWLYTGATIGGEATIDRRTEGGPWPLPPGEYDVVLLADDSYAELARAPFTVTEAS
jgi:hypothetical protein